jgi:hypothetical protein
LREASILPSKANSINILTLFKSSFYFSLFKPIIQTFLFKPIIMYPIYIEQLPYQRHQSQLSVDDYAQIQRLLYQEQRERATLHAYQEQQEKVRLQRAMYKLQRRREQEELAIQAYYENKRRQAALVRQQMLLQKQKEELGRHRLQEEEEAFYAALIEHHQQEQQQQCLYALTQQQQAAKSAEYANPCRAIAEAVAAAQYEQVEEEEEDAVSEPETEPDQKNFETLVTHLFGQEDNEQEEEAAKPELESTNNQDQQHAMTLDQFVNYISTKAQELDNSDHEKDNQQEQIDDDYVQVSSGTNSNQDDTMEEQEDLAALALELIDENEDSMDEDDDDDMPELVEYTASLQNLVHDILTTTEYQDEFTKFPEEDPVKIAKFDALSQIEQELDTIRQQHEDHVLHITLDFPNNGNGSSSDTILVASTAENREFLGYEDQIMKVLLKLDMIESDGDEHVRNERKTLVKRAEAILAKLDDYKQKEWERVSCSSQSDLDEDMD